MDLTRRVNLCSSLVTSSSMAKGSLLFLLASSANPTLARLAAADGCHDCRRRSSRRRCRSASSAEPFSPLLSSAPECRIWF